MLISRKDKVLFWGCVKVKIALKNIGLAKNFLGV